MKRKTRKTPGLTPVREFPYFKIQRWVERVSAWMDIQVRFSTMVELQDFAHKNLATSERTRIVIVEDYQSRRIDLSQNAFGPNELEE